MKKTTYYLLSTDTSNDIYVSNGEKAAIINADSKGFDVNTGVDLYDEWAINNLIDAYKKIDGLYNMDDIERDFPEKIIKPQQQNFNFKITEIITIE